MNKKAGISNTYEQKLSVSIRSGSGFWFGLLL